MISVIFKSESQSLSWFHFVFFLTFSCSLFPSFISEFLFLLFSFHSPILDFLKSISCSHTNLHFTYIFILDMTKLFIKKKKKRYLNNPFFPVCLYKGQCENYFSCCTIYNLQQKAQLLLGQFQHEQCIKTKVIDQPVTRSWGSFLA